MKYAAFMTLEHGRFKELSYFELKDAINDGKTYYVVKVDCPSIREYEEIHVVGESTITLVTKIIGVVRDGDKLCAKVLYTEHSTNIVDADIRIQFTSFHVLDESEITLTEMGRL